MQNLALYFHWPFCKAKCPYCDFNVHIRGAPLDHEVWASAYETALLHYAQILPDRRVVSVFFGGGTPSLMAPQTIERILTRIQKLWPMANALEVTMEANPTSIEAGKFQDFRAAGVTRVSVGVQALNDADLKFLGRQHSVAEARHALDIAARYFERMSFDLIYARPNQTPDAWAAELTQAIPLTRGHLSLYQLTIERNTPFFLRHGRGEFTLPREEEGAALFTLTQEILEAANLPAYEISNHATPGQECVHNRMYWTDGDYIGIGPGAHGRYEQGGVKWAVRDHAAPDVWRARVAAQGFGAHLPQAITGLERASEILMMGLRLREGVDLHYLAEKTGCAPEAILNLAHVSRAVSEGWAVYTPERLTLAREGWLRLNSLIPYLLR